MLTFTSRALREVAFDPAGNRFLGRVELTFSDSADEAPQRARIAVTAILPHRTRFPQIEAALLDEAERQLRLRLAVLDQGPVNIFAEARGRAMRSPLAA